MFNNSPPPFFFFFKKKGKSFRLWDAGEKFCKAGQVTDDTKIRHMRIAYWITWATDTFSEYEVPIAFIRQK